METLWSACDLVQCLTLTTRPDRRRAAADQFAAVGLGERVVFLEQTPDEEDGKRGCFPRISRRRARQCGWVRGAR